MQNDRQRGDQETTLGSIGEGPGIEDHEQKNFRSTVDENCSPDNIQEPDQDWDLQSPLILQEPRYQEPRREARVTPSPLEDVELFSEDDVDPWKLLLTTCSSTTSMLFIGLVAGSFFYPWSNTNIRLKMDTAENSFPVDFQVPLFTDAMFWDTLNIFKSSHSMTLVCLMVTSSIIAPVLWMGFQLFFLSRATSGESPVAQISNATEEQGANGWQILKSELSNYLPQRERIPLYNSFALYFTKFSMSIVYVNALLMVATSDVSFAIGGDFSPSTSQQNRNEDFIHAQVISETRGGLVAYVLGITFGTCAFMILRAQLTQTKDTFSSNICDNSSNESENSAAHETNSKPFLSPPPSAFRMTPNYEELRNQGNQSDLSLSMNESMEQDFQEELSSPLLRRLRREVEDHPLQISQQCSDIITLDEVELPLNNGGNMNWRSIAAFEACIIASLLAFPLATEPVLRLEYAGILSPIFDANIYKSRSFTLLDLILAVTSKSGKGVFPFLTSALLWTNVIIVPFLSLICCCAALLFKTFAKERVASKFKSCAAWVHPLHHFTPFAMSVVATAASLRQVSNFLFDDNEFCSTAKELINSSVNEGGKCLEISASLQIGLLYLVLHTVALDILLQTLSF